MRREENGILGTETRVASGKKGPIFLPSRRIRWVNRETTGGNEECGKGCCGGRTLRGWRAWWEGVWCQLERTLGNRTGGTSNGVPWEQPELSSHEGRRDT